MTKTVYVVMIACLAALVLSGAALAQQPTPNSPITDDQVNAVAKQLYCPVCENTPLDVCPTQACIEWRELIREQLGQGMSAAQIKQYFVDRFGDRVLAAPPPSGFNLLAYLVPPIAILAGVFLLWRALRSWKRPEPVMAAAPRAEAPNADSDDPYIRRLEDELKQRKA